MLGQYGASIIDRTEFGVNSLTDLAGWVPYIIRPGVSMISILTVGGGGAGGAGVKGGSGAAAGGSSGSSGASHYYTGPASLLPKVIYVSVGKGGDATVSAGSAVAIAQNNTVNNRLTYARGGPSGIAGTGATGGVAPIAAATTTLADCPLSGFGVSSFLPSQAGVIGGGTAAGTSVTVPLTGQRCTAGASGAGLGGATTAGALGGSIIGAGAIMGNAAYAGGQLATYPATDGSASIIAFVDLGYWLGGVGGGATYGTASGAGLYAGSGGQGSKGCGGGGGGGGYTGSTGGLGGRGGDGYVVISVW